MTNEGAQRQFMRSLIDRGGRIHTNTNPIATRVVIRDLHDMSSDIREIEKPSSISGTSGGYHRKGAECHGCCNSAQSVARSSDISQVPDVIDLFENGSKNLIRENDHVVGCTATVSGETSCLPPLIFRYRCVLVGAYEWE